MNRKISLLALIIVLAASCRNDKNKVMKSDIAIKAERFDKDLAGHWDNISYLENRYGKFFHLFTHEIVTLGTPDTNELKNRLKDFIHDPDITDIYRTSDSLYAGVSDIEAQLGDAFGYYKSHFPNKLIPRITTFISGFSYSVVSTDSVLGIGLDMYLGSESPYYPGINLPQFRIKNMRREYIASDAMRGWAESEWEANPEHTDLVSGMIYSGKMLYFLNSVLPDVPDTIKTGYSKTQLQWCRENESNVWAFFVDQKLLFETDPNKVNKYNVEGATTNGFPKESPGNIGQWIGYRIVESYMKKHPEIKLSELMNTDDYKKLFNESGYRPGR